VKCEGAFDPAVKYFFHPDVDLAIGRRGSDQPPLSGLSDGYPDSASDASGSMARSGRAGLSNPGLGSSRALPTPHWRGRSGSIAIASRLALVFPAQ